MATNAPAKFWVRTDGSDSNGGGYDASVSSGTSFTSTLSLSTFVADSPPGSGSTAGLGSAIMADSGAGFSSGMVGHAIYAEGGVYMITAYNNSSSANVRVVCGPLSFSAKSGTLAGKNYSDQASPAGNWSTLNLAAGTMTDAGATGQFQADMVSNFVNVPGQGYYLVTAFTSSDIVTVTPATNATTTFSGQPGILGGALRNLYAFATGGGGGIGTPATAVPLVPGNMIFARASGSGSKGAPDYTQTGYATLTVGDDTSGKINWVSYNGVAFIGTDGLYAYTMAYNTFTGFYIYAAAANFGNNGIFHCVSSCEFINCTIDGNNGFGQVGLNLTSGCSAINCEVIGGGGSTAHGIIGASYGSTVRNCKVHGWGSWGIIENSAATGMQIDSCEVYVNVSGGISLSTSGVVTSCVDNCTVDNNTGDGIKVNGTAALGWARIINNNITNNGAYGIEVTGGTVETNDAAKILCDYNNVWTNASGPYFGVSAGPHDLAVDPQYINSAGGNYTPQNTALQGATVPLPL